MSEGKTKAVKTKTVSPPGPVIGGIKVSHPERIVYPEQGYTKLDVANYYDRMADFILPYLQGRPVSIIRCPDGLAKACFFQRHVSGRSAQYVTQLPIKEPDSGDAYFAIDTKEALLSMVQFNAIEFHPWGSTSPKFDKADRIIFDLDPDPKIDFPSIKAAAFLIKDRLEEIGLQSFVKTTGGKGLHIVAPIAAEHPWDKIKQFAREFVQKLESDFPDAFTTNTLKVKRKGKIFLDYLRNDETSTAVAAFSLRARAGAPSSIPLTWDKLKKMKSLELPSILAKLPKGFKDEWQGMMEIKQKLKIK